MTTLGKVLAIAGVVMAVAGVILMFSDKIPFIGKLPGDFTFKRGNFTFYFPLATSIIISIFVSLIVYFFRGRS